MPLGAYESSLARFAAGAGARVQALVSSLLGPQLRQLEPAVAARMATARAARAAAAAGGGGG